MPDSQRCFLLVNSAPGAQFFCNLNQGGLYICPKIADNESNFFNFTAIGTCQVFNQTLDDGFPGHRNEWLRNSQCVRS